MTTTPYRQSRIALLRSLADKKIEEFPSPVTGWLDGIIREVGDDSYAIEFTVKEYMTNSIGLLHGGAAAAMLDEMLGTLAFLIGREHAYVTLNLSCDFITPAKVGETLLARGIVIRSGKNIAHCEGKLTAVDGRIVAKAVCNLMQSGIRLTF